MSGGLGINLRLSLSRLSSISEALFSNALASVAGTSVTLTWDTDFAATTAVEWGADTSYGNAAVNSLDDGLGGETGDGIVTAHTLVLSLSDGLLEGTTYHYRLAAYAAGQWYYSSDKVFVTGGVSLPSISGVSAVPASQDINFSWTTNSGADTHVLWGTTPTLGNIKSLSNNVTSHILSLGAADGLLTGRYCHYQVSSSSDGLNYSYSDLSSVFLPLILTSIAAVVDGTTITITWTSDLGSDSSVEWGLTGSYGNTTTSLDNGVTSHTVVIDYEDGIREDNTYNFRVVSSVDGRVTSSYSTNQTLNVPVIVAGSFVLEGGIDYITQENDFEILLQTEPTDFRITDLSPAAVLAGGDLMPGVQSGNTVAITLDQIRTFVRS